MRDFGEIEEPDSWVQRILHFLFIPIRWVAKASVIFTGCIIAIPIAMFFTAALGAVISLLIHGIHYTPDLPEKIITNGTVFEEDVPGGLLEGCLLKIYELSPETKNAIKKEGFHFFENMPQPPNTSSHFGPWKRTPIPISDDIQATSALQGCQIQTVGIHDDSEPGNYYSLTGNGEGIIIVVPSRNIVVYGYFG